jgi:cytochrome P450
MKDFHRAFFETLNWFDEADCEVLDSQLKWARQQCPVAHTKYDGGMHIVTRYEDLRTVGENPEVFSSSMPGVNNVPVPLPPLDLDPPLHREFRSILNPYFSHSFLEANYRKAMEKLADDLIDHFIDLGETEFISEFAIPFTAGSLAKVVFDDDNEERLARAIDAVTANAVENTPESFQGIAAIAAELFEERASSGANRDDLLQSIVNARSKEGRALTQGEMLGVVTVLMLGGLDTTRGLIGAIGQFLAEIPEVEERMRCPNWIRGDLDEFLRFTSVVSVMGRLVKQDNDLLGLPLKAGDRLAVHWRSGNRDEAKFDRPDELVFDRAKNPHIAFGHGIHRCVGQHFARLQVEVAFTQLLTRVTNLRVAEGTSVRQAVGITNRAPEEMHLVFDKVATTAR